VLKDEQALPAPSFEPNIERPGIRPRMNLLRDTSPTANMPATAVPRTPRRDGLAEHLGYCSWLGSTRALGEQ
jgi:hypothetical protein